MIFKYPLNESTLKKTQRKKDKSGYIYIVANKAWQGWYKVGMCIETEHRLANFQIGSPHRDYEMLYSKYFTDRLQAESDAHILLEKNSEERREEWFKIPLQTAIDKIEKELKWK